MNEADSLTFTDPRETFSRTLTQLGEHGAAGSSQAADWLCQRSPAEATGALLSLASRQGVELTPEYRTMFPENGPSYRVMAGCRVHGDPVAVAAFRERARRFLTPAEQTRIEGWLAELSVLVAKRDGDEFTETLRLEAYARRLMAYPADVARAVLLGRRWQFWPTWAELETECERLAAERRGIVHAIEKGATAAAPNSREWKPPTEEEKARVRAMYEQFQRENPRAAYRGDPDLLADIWAKANALPGKTAADVLKARE